MRVEARKAFKVDDVSVEMGDRLHIVACCWGDKHNGIVYLVENAKGVRFFIDPKFLDISGR